MRFQFELDGRVFDILVRNVRHRGFEQFTDILDRLVPEEHQIRYLESMDPDAVDAEFSFPDGPQEDNDDPFGDNSTASDSQRKPYCYEEVAG
jgi:hypothetical protein